MAPFGSFFQDMMNHALRKALELEEAVTGWALAMLPRLPMNFQTSVISHLFNWLPFSLADSFLV